MWLHIDCFLWFEHSSLQQNSPQARLHSQKRNEKEKVYLNLPLEVQYQWHRSIGFSPLYSTVFVLVRPIFLICFEPKIGHVPQNQSLKPIIWPPGSLYWKQPSSYTTPGKQAVVFSSEPTHLFDLGWDNLAHTLQHYIPVYLTWT